MHSTTGVPQPAGNSGTPGHDFNHPISYRGDIDGLRAIAVGSVVLFHLLPSRLPAGGIGVDLFFVISGYLIGRIVLESAAAGKFSFRAFYLRRVRRIAPAFLATVLATAAVATTMLYPWELAAFARSTMAALACASNIYFWATADYFGPDSTTLPLLHTWSLGVEEQFYLFFPLLPLALAQVRQRALTGVLVATGLLSLAISIWQVQHAGTAAFYLLPSRWWELMAGVAATRLPDRWTGRAARLRLPVALVGAALVAASFVLVRPAAGFPGLAAVPVVLGTALLLVSGQAGGTIVHRALANAPMRLIGKASYSLYLWHWPVIVLYMMQRVVSRPDATDTAVILALTVALGFGSWHFVEKPFRARSMTPRKLGAWCGGGFALALVLQAVLVAAQGFPQRFSQRVLEIARQGDGPTAHEPPYRCTLRFEDPPSAYDGKRCLASVPGKPDWLLVGDSHASMLWGGLAETLPQVNVHLAVVYACNVSTDPVPSGRACEDLIHRALVEYPAAARPAAVLLTWRWQWVDAEGLTRLNRRLQALGVRLVVIGPTPMYSAPIPRILAETVRRSDPGLSARALRRTVWPAEQQLQALAPTAGFIYLSPMRAMCQPDRGCILTNAKGRSIYNDSDHYTPEGSVMVWRRMLAASASRLPLPTQP
ncbi:MAG: acyltransferase [Sphingomonadales bacterium]|nr:acyltransferase [Sphingomonadales bacterium]